MKKIGLIGYGWVGIQFAEAFREQYAFWGTTTSEDKKTKLEQKNLRTFLYNSSNPIPAEMQQEIEKSDVIVLTVPPVRTQSADGIQEDKEAYFKQLERLISAIPADRKIIFTSSTGIYQHKKGIVFENDVRISEEDNSMACIEWQLHQKFKNNLTVLRLGGLVSNDRHYGHFFVGKENLPFGLDFVNIVHTGDVIRIIDQVIEKNMFGETFNVVSDCHQTRDEFYGSFCKNRNLKPPVFQQNVSPNAKIVENKKVKELLGITFKNLSEQVKN